MTPLIDKELSMSFADRKKRILEQKEIINKKKLERAKSTVNSILNSESFINSVLTAPEAKMDIDYIMNEAIREVTNPVADFIDVLTSRGLHEAEIRKIVYKVYDFTEGKVDSSGHTINRDDITYEEQLEIVASYAYVNQGIYDIINGLNLDD